MPIDNITWHARIGMFCILKPLLKSKSNIRICSVHFALIFILDIIFFYFKSVFSIFSCTAMKKSSFYLRLLKNLPKIVKVIIFLLHCLPNLLFCCGDIEKNPGPKYSSLKFCHWNLNGLTAHDGIKIYLLQVYIIQNNYDIICLSEMFLNSSIETNDDRISIDGYNLIRADHPSNSKRGGVCIYFKEHIPLIKRDDICTLDNCLVTETRSQGEKNFLACVYRSPSQNHDEFEDFCTKFDLLMSSINDELPLCSVITGDFNAGCSRWWKNDISNPAGQEIESLTSSAGYKQITDKPRHVINNSMSCIDLICCANQNVISNYGVDVSLFNKCHHNIIHGKIDIRVPLPPVFVREVWYYSKANVENIKKAVANFNWKRAFENLYVDEKVELLNETLLNIFRNYIPNKKIKCDYRQPPWMTDDIQKSLKQISKLTKYFIKTVKEIVIILKFCRNQKNALI